MLHYSNIINDPYPDTVDPVTGEWLPKSYNDIKAEQFRKQREVANEQAKKSSLKDVFNLISMIK